MFVIVTICYIKLYIIYMCVLHDRHLTPMMGTYRFCHCPAQSTQGAWMDFLGANQNGTVVHRTDFRAVQIGAIMNHVSISTY